MVKKILFIAIASILIMSGCTNNPELNNMLSKKGGLNKDGSYTGKGKIATKEYDLDNFSKLNVGNDFEVTISKSEEFKVQVTTNEDVFELLDIDTKGDVLKAYNIDGVRLKDTKVTMNIACPEIDKIMLSNDVLMNIIDDNILGDNFEAELSNDSILKGSINASSLIAILSNDSLLELNGVADNISIEAHNDARALLSKVEGKVATLILSNDAICDINVKGDINASAENSPTINIYNGTLKSGDMDEDVVINNKK